MSPVSLLYSYNCHFLYFFEVTLACKYNEDMWDFVFLRQTWFIELVSFLCRHKKSSVYLNCGGRQSLNKTSIYSSMVNQKVYLFWSGSQNDSQTVVILTTPHLTQFCLLRYMQLGRRGLDWNLSWGVHDSLLGEYWRHHYCGAQFILTLYLYTKSFCGPPVI